MGQVHTTLTKNMVISMIMEILLDNPAEPRFGDSGGNIREHLSGKAHNTCSSPWQETESEGVSQVTQPP